MAARSTKDRIVDAAIDLFNAEGVTPVTTNHIAAHLGISPGNLYYHYGNKEEIVRAAFERMNAEAEQVWRVEPDGHSAFDPLALQRIVAGNLDLYARYLFFARELPSLLRADRALAERHAAISTARMEQLEAMLAALVEAGLLRDVGDRDDVRTLAETAWMIGLFCVPYAETQGGAAPAPRSAKARTKRAREAIERGALLVLHLFKPYMDPIAWSGLVVLVRQQIHEGERA